MGSRFFTRRRIHARPRTMAESFIGVPGPGMTPAPADRVAGFAAVRNPNGGVRLLRLAVTIGIATLLGTAFQEGIALRADFRREAASRCPTGMVWRFDVTLPSSVIADGLAGAELYLGIGACAL